MGCEGLNEAEQVPVEVKAGLDVVSLEIDERGDVHAGHVSAVTVRFM